MNYNPSSEKNILEIAQKFNKQLKKLLKNKNENPGIDQDKILKFKALFYSAKFYEQTSKSNPEIEITTSVLKEEIEILGVRIKNLIKIFHFHFQTAYPYDSETWNGYRYSELEYAAMKHENFRKFLDNFMKLAYEKAEVLKATKSLKEDMEKIENLSKKFSEKHDELLLNIKRIENGIIIRRNYINELSELIRIIHNSNPAILPG